MADRPIEELLKISDYSTMTNNEIDTLIAYKAQQAATQAVENEKTKTMLAGMEAVNDIHRQAAQHAIDILYANTAPTLETYKVDA